MSLVTPVYGAIICLLFVFLSVRTLLLRRRLGVGVGDGGHPVLTRAMRAHGNCAEYVPIALLLVFFLELNGGTSWWIHILCLLLILGRLSHAFGISQLSENYAFRVFGMATTFTVMISASLRILSLALF
ncbi:MAG: MAPEG family protein [Pseudomonadota bacterium]